MCTPNSKKKKTKWQIQKDEYSTLCKLHSLNKQLNLNEIKNKYILIEYILIAVKHLT